VYDKTVRRRRAVLGLLVACSLILLTAYFGESAGGGLHSVQRGVLEVVGPIQEGASRTLKPFRDLFGWVGDTVSAKGRAEDLEKERNALRAQAVAGEQAVRENARLNQLLDLDTNAQLSDNDPKTARVIGQAPTVWFSEFKIDKGSSAGIRPDQPVVTGAGLIGRVRFVARGFAIVSLITDHTVKVSARVAESGVPGVLKTAVGDPRDLVLQFVTRDDPVKPGQRIVTAGTGDTRRLTSLFPPGIPIGRVTRVEDPETDDQVVHVKPYADARRVEFVQVLTRSQDGNRR
jgi:rod shape-determining protein MreC